MEKILEGTYGMPKNSKVGIGGVGTASGGEAGEAGGPEGGGDGSGSSEKRKDAARVLSTISGAAFTADGVGRELAGIFTATSDGIFFQ